MTSVVEFWRKLVEYVLRIIWIFMIYMFSFKNIYLETGIFLQFFSFFFNYFFLFNRGHILDFFQNFLYKTLPGCRKTRPTLPNCEKNAIVVVTLNPGGIDDKKIIPGFFLFDLSVIVRGIFCGGQLSSIKWSATVSAAFCSSWSRLMEDWLSEINEKFVRIKYKSKARTLLIKCYLTWI